MRYLWPPLGTAYRILYYGFKTNKCGNRTAVKVKSFQVDICELWIIGPNGNWILSSLLGRSYHFFTAEV